MSSQEHLPRKPAGPAARPLAQTAVIIYATLFLLATAIPQGLTNWLKNIDPNSAQVAALDAATEIELLSNRLGLSRPYSEARRVFLDVMGLRDR